MDKPKLTIEQLRLMRESEDHIEFKRCQQGNLSFNGADKKKPAERRKCILGYVVALANAGGGHLVMGMEDEFPHNVVGTRQNENVLGQLENDIYKALQIPVDAYELRDEKNLRVVVVSIPRHPNLAEYSGLTDWDDQQVLAVLLPFLTKYGKAKKADIASVIGPHISDTQLRRTIERLTQPGGPLIKTGKTANTVYSLSPEFRGQMSLLQEATRIGLSHILKNQEIKAGNEEDKVTE